MEALIHRDYSPGKSPFLSSETEQEVRRILEHSTPAEEGDG
ncbi:hypothetical protein [Metabacillus rhizolycopersici]|nr:hypothetical protein [Metabacillus rhizolycopersici]